MVCGRWCGVAASVAVAMVAFLLYAPTPETDDDLLVPAGPNTALSLPYTVWLSKCLQRASVRLATWGDTLGIVEYAATRRELTQTFSVTSEEDASDLQITDSYFDGVKVRLYKPESTKSGGPGIIYFHGGKFFQGSVDTHHHVTTQLARRLQSMVVSVQYPLSPEKPYPKALHDCVTATKFFITHAADFMVDPHRVAVAGDEAGGNLAAAVATMLKSDAFQPKPKLQVLIQPLLQALDLELPSHQMRTTSSLGTRTAVAMAAMLYAGKSTSFAREHAAAVVARNHTSMRTKEQILSILDIGLLPQEFLEDYEPKPFIDGFPYLIEELENFVLDPLAFPLVSNQRDLEDLPSAIIVTAEYDVLRDDGVIYARRLEAAGVHTTWHHIEKGFHGMTHYLDSQSGMDFIKKTVLSIIDQL